MPTLVELEIEALWEVDERGRLTGSRPTDPREPPVLVLVSDGAEIVWTCRASAGESVTATIEELVEAETPAVPVRGAAWSPGGAEQLVACANGAEVTRGISYVIEQPIDVPTGIEWSAGGASDVDRLSGLMPEQHRNTLQEPWAVVHADGKVAAVCETARSAPRSVEAGLWTYEEYRRRGFGRAAVAAWSSLVADRTIFYSTSSDNLASQAVAASLGLEPLAMWWQVYAAGE